MSFRPLKVRSPSGGRAPTVPVNRPNSPGTPSKGHQRSRSDASGKNLLKQVITCKLFR